MCPQLSAPWMGASNRTFHAQGRPEDKSNLQKIQQGSFGDGKTLDELVAHPNAQVAKLKVHHVLALRLYTSSSYSVVNNPLRKDPPERPHPFAATSYFIDQGIKFLRAVAASQPDAHTMRVYWRGMADLGLKMEFLQKGGTEFAFASTSAVKDVAVAFAESGLPLIFKFVTKDFAQRGADISFLSVRRRSLPPSFAPRANL